MSQLLYFIEGEQAGSQSLYERLGLGYALAPSASARNATSGPGGSGGIAVGRLADGLGFFPDRQEWHDLGERDGRRIWCGWARDSRPAPVDLATGHALRGHQVQLFDDRDWSVPVAVQFEDGAFGPAVPATLRMDPDGQLRRGEVKPCYARLWEIASEFWGQVGQAEIDEQGLRFTISDATQKAAEVLAVNYRLTIREACALGLFDDRGEAAMRILWAAVDWPTYLEWASKKKEPELSAA